MASTAQGATPTIQVPDAISSSRGPPPGEEDPKAQVSAPLGSTPPTGERAGLHHASTSDAPLVLEDDEEEKTHFAKIVEYSPKGRYGRFNQRLGEGAFKRVYKAYDTHTGFEVAWNAVKINALKGDGGKRILKEMKILQTLNHRSIIQFHGSWISKQSQSVCFVTELISGGTLKDFIKVRTVRMRILKRWCRHILRALTYLHQHDPPIIHRDLKCENIFINASGSIRVGDLGLASWERHGEAKSVLGTPEYMAPELYNEQYDEQVDIYAFGMCVLEMITKQTPYSECTSALQIMKKVTSEILPVAYTDLAEGPQKDFIFSCIRPLLGTERRPSASELLDHPFLVGVEASDETVDCLTLLNPDSQLWKLFTNRVSPSVHQTEAKDTEGSATTSSSSDSVPGSLMSSREERVSRHARVVSPLPSPERKRVIRNTPEDGSTITYTQQRQNTETNTFSPLGITLETPRPPTPDLQRPATPDMTRQKADDQPPRPATSDAGRRQQPQVPDRQGSDDPKSPPTVQRFAHLQPHTVKRVSSGPIPSDQQNEVVFPVPKNMHRSKSASSTTSAAADHLPCAGVQANGNWCLNATRSQEPNVMIVELVTVRDAKRTGIKFDYNITNENPHETAAEIVKSLGFPLDELTAVENELARFCDHFNSGTLKEHAPAEPPRGDHRQAAVEPSSSANKPRQGSSPPAPGNPSLQTPDNPSLQAPVNPNRGGTHTAAAGKKSQANVSTTAVSPSSGASTTLDKTSQLTRPRKRSTGGNLVTAGSQPKPKVAPNPGNQAKPKTRASAPAVPDVPVLDGSAPAEMLQRSSSGEESDGRVGSADLPALTSREGSSASFRSIAELASEVENEEERDSEPGLARDVLQDLDVLLDLEEKKLQSLLYAQQESLTLMKSKRDTMVATAEKMLQVERIQVMSWGAANAMAAAAVAKEVQLKRRRRSGSNMSTQSRNKQKDEPKTKEQLREEAFQKTKEEKLKLKQIQKEEAKGLEKNLEAQLFGTIGGGGNTNPRLSLNARKSAPNTSSKKIGDRHLSAPVTGSQGPISGPGAAPSQRPRTPSLTFGSSPIGANLNAATVANTMTTGHLPQATQQQVGPVRATTPLVGMQQQQPQPSFSHSRPHGACNQVANNPGIPGTPPAMMPNVNQPSFAGQQPPHGVGIQISGPGPAMGGFTGIQLNMPHRTAGAGGLTQAGGVPRTPQN